MPNFPQIFVFLIRDGANDFDSCRESLRRQDQYEPLMDANISSGDVEIEKHLYSDWG